MNNERHSHYRGCSIVTRCLEETPHSDWARLDAVRGHWSPRFTASFSVSLNNARDEPWQQFPKARFGTRDQASDNALATAKRAIDLALAG